MLAGVAGIPVTLSSGYSSPVWPAAGVAVVCPADLGLALLAGGLARRPAHGGSTSRSAAPGLAALTSAPPPPRRCSAPGWARRYLQGSLPFALTGTGPVPAQRRTAGLPALLLVGTAALFLGGKSSARASCSANRPRWWSGDTLGVLLFTPLTRLLWPGAHPFRVLAGGYRFALPLIVTTALLVLGHLGLTQLEELRARSQSHALMAAISDGGTQELAETLLPLEGLAHFFSASAEVSRAEFREYTPQLSQPSGDPCGGLGAAHRGRAARRVRDPGRRRRLRHLPHRRAERPRRTAKRRAARRSFPILYSEPLAASRHVLGLDHGFEVLRHQAMRVARKNGSAIASDQIRLARTDRHASLVYIPVWRRSGEYRSEDGKRRLAGYVVGVLDIHQLFTPLLQRAREHRFAVRITDVTENAKPRRLIDDLSADARPDWHHDFHFGGRTWRLEMQPEQPVWQPGSTSEERFFLAFAMLDRAARGVRHLSSAGRHTFVSRQVSERTAQLRSELDARSAAEQALHISEERYRRLIELSPFGVLVQCDGICMFVNSSTLAMFGARSADQLLGQSLLDFIHPDSRAIALERLSRRTEGRSVPDSAVVHYRRLDGTYSWIELTSVAYQYEGRPGSLVLLNDISARIHAEQQRDRFFTLSLDLFCIASTDGYFRSVNPSFTRVLGWSEQELLSCPLLDFVHPDDLAATRDELQRLAHNDSTTLGFENRYRCKDGSWRWLAWKALPQPGQLLFATAHDTTEQHRAARRLTELNDELQQRIEERNHTLSELHAKQEEIRAVLDHLLECVITIDCQGIVRSVNPAIEQLLGYRPEELLGRNVACLMDSPQRERHDDYLARYLRTGERHIIGFSREVTGRHKDGSAVSVELSVSEYNINGERLFVGTLRDIRERQALIASLTQARAAAEQASRAKSSFLATMSHEIRTPMNGVIGLVDVLAQDRLSPYQNDLLKTIRESAGNLLRIIDDILDFSKIEAGKLDIQRDTLDLPALIEEQCRALMPLASAKGVDLAIHIDAEVPQWTAPMRCVCGRSSATCWATPSSSRATAQSVRRPRAGRGARASAGRGGATARPRRRGQRHRHHRRAPAQPVQPLHPGRKLDHSPLRRHRAGAGDVKRLVDLMGGDIGVDSSPSRGSLFSVRLPLEPASAPPAEPTLPEPTPRVTGRSYRILVAEDDAVNRKVIQHQLALLGHRCDTARDGVEALEMWRQGGYDLLLTDLHMPDMDGYQLAEQVRRGAGPAAHADPRPHRQRPARRSRQGRGGRDGRIPDQADPPRHPGGRARPLAAARPGRRRRREHPRVQRRGGAARRAGAGRAGRRRPGDDCRHPARLPRLARPARPAARRGLRA